jgi:hypothetical protein
MTPFQVVGRCALHPEREAIEICSRCGNYACLDCIPGGAPGALCTSCEQAKGASRYHVVPVWRMVLISVLTSGLYQVYWLYKNWQQIKQADRSDIWPIVRAIFGGITYFMLLSDLNLQTARRSLHESELSAGIAVGYLLTSMTFRLPDPWSLISVASVVFLVPATKRIWELSPQSARDRAGRWALRHTLITLVAVPFWALAIVGMLAGEE